MRHPRLGLYTLQQPAAHYSLLGAACAVGLFLRFDGLTRELTHDEAYSWVVFASRSKRTRGE